MSRETIAMRTPREWLDLPLFLSKTTLPHRRVELRESWAQFPYVYLSYLRPLTLVRGPDLGTAAEVRFFDADGGTKTVVFSKVPLAVDRLDAYELVPFTTLAMGRYIVDQAALEGIPLELRLQVRPDREAKRIEAGALPDHVRAVLLFRNPRQVWQLSYFEEKVGPVGHEETDKDPARMVGEAWLHGYRELAPGVIDAIMGTVREGAR